MMFMLNGYGISTFPQVWLQVSSAESTATIPTIMVNAATINTCFAVITFIHKLDREKTL
jgi:hypothetical protein